MQITPINLPLHATVRVPGSKSLTARALLLASLAHGKTRLVNTLFSDDSLYFSSALRKLGFNIQLDEANSEMTVTGLGGKIPANAAELFIGNSGTAARFLTAFLTLGSGEYILDGEPRMRERPIGDLVQSLTQLGANIQSRNTATDNWSLLTDYSYLCPPLKIIASGLQGGKTKISGNISSQFLSALLMVGPYAKSLVQIEISSDLNSKPYVDMTIAIMQDFGVHVKRSSYQSFCIPLAIYQLPSTEPQSPVSYAIESDASAASYFFAAPAVCGGTVRVENISRKSKQGDIAFLDVLQQMGCTINEGDRFIEVTGTKSLKGIDMDMRDIPDTAQTLAAIAPFGSSPTRIRGIKSARVKETDRVHATCTELTRLGVRVDEHEDGMTIYPVERIRPALIQTYNDHRMAMAFSLIGLRQDGVTIENPSCVSKTFPNYFDVLETLR